MTKKWLKLSIILAKKWFSTSISRSIFILFLLIRWSILLNRSLHQFLTRYLLFDWEKSSMLTIYRRKLIVDADGKKVLTVAERKKKQTLLRGAKIRRKRKDFSSKPDSICSLLTHFEIVESPFVLDNRQEKRPNSHQ